MHVLNTDSTWVHSSRLFWDAVSVLLNLPNLFCGLERSSNRCFSRAPLTALQVGNRLSAPTKQTRYCGQCVVRWGAHGSTTVSRAISWLHLPNLHARMVPRCDHLAVERGQRRQEVKGRQHSSTCAQVSILRASGSHPALLSAQYNCRLAHGTQGTSVRGDGKARQGNTGTPWGDDAITNCHPCRPSFSNCS